MNKKKGCLGFSLSLFNLSRHVKDEGDEGTDHNQCVHEVPNVSQIGSGMSDDAQINHLTVTQNPNDSHIDQGFLGHP